MLIAILSRRPTGFLTKHVTALGIGVEQGEIPDYPIPYDAELVA